MHRNYYANGRNYEPIDVIRDWDLNFNLGNAVKYISRFGRKGTRGDAVEDLNKAIDYLIHEKEYILGEQEAHDNEETDLY